MKNLLILMFSCIIIISESIGQEYIGSLSISYLNEISESCTTDYKELTEILIENMLSSYPNCKGAEISIEENKKYPDLLDVYANCNKWGI